MRFFYLILVFIIASAALWFGSKFGQLSDVAQDPLPTESRKLEPDSSIPSDTLLDEGRSVSTGSTAIPNETGCASSKSQANIPRSPDIPTHLPPFNYHNDVSEEQLLKRAMADDGYAQEVYATRIQVRITSELRNIDFSEADVRDRWIGDFELMEEMYISAIQNRSVPAARLLGDTLLFPTPKRDPIKAAAWLLIEEQMGGNYIVKTRNTGTLALTEDEKEISRLLAASYIDEFDLWFLDPETPLNSTNSASKTHYDNRCSDNLMQ